MIDPIRPFIDHQNVFILDGGLATELEKRGHNLNDPLWSAKILLEQPEAIRQVHSDYLWAGADCIISASYQASLPGLMARGLSPAAAADLIRRSVQLAIEARDQFWAVMANRRQRLRSRLSTPMAYASMSMAASCSRSSSGAARRRSAPRSSASTSPGPSRAPSR